MCLVAAISPSTNEPSTQIRRRSNERKRSYAELECVLASNVAATMLLRPLLARRVQAMAINRKARAVARTSKGTAQDKKK